MSTSCKLPELFRCSAQRGDYAVKLGRECLSEDGTSHALFLPTGRLHHLIESIPVLLVQADMKGRIAAISC